MNGAMMTRRGNLLHTLSLLLCLFSLSYLPCIDAEDVREESHFRQSTDYVESSRSLALQQREPDVVIAGTLEGILYAFDAWTGRIKWSFDTGGAMLWTSLYQSTEQVPKESELEEERGKEDARMTVDITPDGFNRPTKELVPGRQMLVRATQVVAAFDGTLFSVDTRSGEPKALKLGISIRDLVNRGTPLSATETGLADTILLGKKDMKIVALDMQTGRTDYVVQALDAREGGELWTSNVGEYVLHKLPGEPLPDDMENDAANGVRARKPTCASSDSLCPMHFPILERGREDNDRLLIARDAITSTKLWEVELPSPLLSVFGIASQGEDHASSLYHFSSMGSPLEGEQGPSKGIVNGVTNRDASTKPSEDLVIRLEQGQKMDIDEKGKDPDTLFLSDGDNGKVLPPFREVTGTREGRDAEGERIWLSGLTGESKGDDAARVFFASNLSAIAVLAMQNGLESGGIYIEGVFVAWRVVLIAMLVLVVAGGFVSSMTLKYFKHLGGKVRETWRQEERPTSVPLGGDTEALKTLACSPGTNSTSSLTSTGAVSPSLSECDPCTPQGGATGGSFSSIPPLEGFELSSQDEVRASPIPSGLLFASSSRPSNARLKRRNSWSDSRGQFYAASPFLPPPLLPRKSVIEGDRDLDLFSLLKEKERLGEKKPGDDLLSLLLREKGELEYQSPYSSDRSRPSKSRRNTVDELLSDGLQRPGEESGSEERELSDLLPPSRPPRPRSANLSSVSYLKKRRRKRSLSISGGGILSFGSFGSRSALQRVIEPQDRERPADEKRDKGQPSFVTRRPPPVSTRAGGLGLASPQRRCWTVGGGTRKRRVSSSSSSSSSSRDLLEQNKETDRTDAKLEERKDGVERRGKGRERRRSSGSRSDGLAPLSEDSSLDSDFVLPASVFAIYESAIAKLDEERRRKEESSPPKLPVAGTATTLVSSMESSALPAEVTEVSEEGTGQSMSSTSSYSVDDESRDNQKAGSWTDDELTRECLQRRPKTSTEGDKTPGRRTEERPSSKKLGRQNAAFSSNEKERRKSPTPSLRSLESATAPLSSSPPSQQQHGSSAGGDKEKERRASPPPPSSSSSDPAIPFVCSLRYLNEFEELSVLGKGGFGHVVLARNRLDGRQYAVKKVRLSSAEHWKPKLEKVLREVKILALLDHPNIVRYYQAWLENVEDGVGGGVRGRGGGSTLDSSVPLLTETADLYTVDGKDEIEEDESRSPSAARSASAISQGKEKQNREIGAQKGKRKGFWPSSLQDIHGWFLKSDAKHLEGLEDDSAMHTFDSPSLGETGFEWEEASEESVKAEGKEDCFEEEEGNEGERRSSKGREDCFSLSLPEVQQTNTQPFSGAGCQDAGQASRKEEKRERKREARRPPTVYDLLLYIQMQFCSEKTLTDYLASPDRQGANIKAGIRIFVQIARALQHVHHCGLIHRDLKPANVFMAGDGEEGSVKLGDFGLSRHVDHLPSSLSPSSSSRAAGGSKRDSKRMFLKGDNTAGVGTLLYASPEQMAERAYDSKTDMYSLGMILLELSLPSFTTSMERIQVLRQARLGSFPDFVTAKVKDEHPIVFSLIQQLLSKTPTARPSATEVLAQCEYLHLSPSLNPQRFQVLQLIADREGAGAKEAGREAGDALATGKAVILRVEGREDPNLLVEITEAIRKNSQVRILQSSIRMRNGIAVYECMLESPEASPRAIQDVCDQIQDVVGVHEIKQFAA